MNDWNHGDIVTNGVRLHYVEAGQGPLVLLLHGFPEFWYSWRHQIPPLARAGFHVVAPDLRGYNQSAKPAGVRAYRMETLADDVAGLVSGFGERRAVVVGHDWGGAAAWMTAARHPSVVERLVALNCPHPGAFLRHALTHLEQLRRSWYMFLFQLPLVPEALLRRHDYALLDRVLARSTVHRGAFSADDLTAYRRALAQPGALRAALAYYRAGLRYDLLRLLAPWPRIDAPTLVIWGERDPALGVELLDGLERHVRDLRIERIPDASHWVQVDAPERVTALLLGFLRAS